jgi:hypothetical protein
VSSSDTEAGTDNDTRRASSRPPSKVLTRALGGPIRLGPPQSLRDKYRNRVLRCRVEEAPSGAPPSVIVKAAVGEGENVYDPRTDKPESTAWRFFNEWAGARFLNERVSDPPLSARFFGADPAHGVLVLEDLGSGPALSDELQGDDPDAATNALLRYAASMGRLHAQTIGGEADWRRIRNEVSQTRQEWAARRPSGAKRTPARSALIAKS